MSALDALLETLEMGGQLGIDPACTDEIHHSGRGGESSTELAQRLLTRCRVSGGESSVGRLIQVGAWRLPLPWL